MPHTLTLDERTHLRRAIDTYGEVTTARRLGVSRSSTIRALAGLSCRRGTIALIRAHFGAILDDDQAAA